ncbi:hypothetical protein HK099_008497 [Clydaea vesicula]|uniref:Uncharacterized protein n=1 Tax=Clydaea vesicula TaxID=447962 RepID=A0AAD5U4T1_9FUNG|nr:hypothetical protein HK099_008497 [Clydaea vesicula]
MQIGNLENLNSGVDYIVNKDENIIDRGVTASEDKNSEIKVHYYDNLLNEPKVPVEMIDAKLNNIKKKHRFQLRSKHK